MAKLFQPTFESLYEYTCPDWFRDAKFGIWSHWGPQSVPMYGDWYARHMYVEGSEQYKYHVRHYGHPSKFGYKDICALWKAEKFDPQGLMDLYYKAGARYFMSQATHHDNFFNYDSKVNRMNAVNVGPHKDICGLWKAAAEKNGMPFGMSEHLAASFSWWRANKGHDLTGPYAGVPYDGNDPEYKDFYYDNMQYVNPDGTAMQDAPWMTDDKRHWAYWQAAVSEMIEKYAPDLLYSDSALPFGDDRYQPGLDIVAQLYNRSIGLHGSNQAIYLQKDRRPQIYKVGILDIEKSQLDGIQERPWHTDTCIGNWFYDVRQNYKKPGHIIEMLVDIISKNGTMLLNVLQKPDGSIDEWAEYILTELASWFAVASEGVYGTRPWEVPSEGESRVVIQGFTENQVDWKSSDYRFTCKGKAVYAFMMKTPESRVAVLHSFAGRKIASVELLGEGKVPFEMPFGTLTVQLPGKMPTNYTNCLKITLAD